MTLFDYLVHPAGKGVPQTPVTIIQKAVQEEIDEYYPKIDYRVYKTANHTLIVHCKLPSRSKAKIFFDVVLELTVVEEEHSRATFARFETRFFSNAQAFSYTFARAFDKQDLLCPWLKSKYQPEIFQKQSKERNPADLINYERSIYTCAFYLYNVYRNKPMMDIYEKAPLTTYEQVAANVMTQKALEEKYAKADESEISRKKKEEKAAELAEKEKWRRAAEDAKRADKAKKERAKQVSQNSGRSQKSSKTPTTGRTGRTGKTKTTKKI